MRRLIFILCAMIGVSQAQTIQYIGAPTTTVISRGNFRTDSIFYLPKRSKAPTDTAAFRYQISDSSLYVWTGSQWVKAGGSGTISGSGITGYVPQFNGTTTIDTSALFTLGNRLGIGTSTFAYNSTNTANMELNGTAGGILGFKRNDSARGYLWHTGDNMELANTVAGSIFFNTNSATRGSISSAGVWRLHNLAGTGDRAVVASSNGTLSASTSVTGLVDTTTISTRAWRQKGDDSLGAIIATKGNGTVTSVATGYGLSGGTITTTGTLLVDTLNIATRAWRQKGLDSLAALEVSGSGTTNYVPKFTAGSTIGNSQIFDNGTSVGIGTTTPTAYTGYTTLALNNNTNGSVLDFMTNGSVVGQLFNDASNFYVDAKSTAPLILRTNATERLRIFANGRIGINTTTDAGYQFDVNGSIRATSTIRSDGNFYNESANPAYSARLNTVDGQRINMEVIGTDGRIQVTRNSGTQPNLVFSTEGGEKMRITAAGNVGIGTASPTQKLEVAGNISVTGVAGGTRYIIVGDATNTYTGALNLQAGGGSGTWGGGIVLYGNSHATYPGGVWIGNSQGASGPIMFGSGGIGPVSEFMRLTGAGELLINTTSDAGDYKLQVSGNIYNTGSAVLSATSGEAYIGTTSDAGNYKLQVSGQAFIRNTATSGSLYLDSTSLSIYEVKNRHAILISGHSLTGAEIQGPIYVGTNWNTSSDVSAIEVALTNTASGANSNLMKLSDGTNTFRVTKDAGIFTAAPSGGTARKWKLGSVVATTVILDTANYVEVEINGVAYKLALVTPN